MATSPFEDDYGDILKKALFGSGISEAAAATRTGIPPAVIRGMLESRPKPGQTEVESMAALLGLSPDRLVRLALNPGQPRIIGIPANLSLLGNNGGKSANSYLLRCPASKASFVIDPGGEPGAVIEAATLDGFKFMAMFLTHGHSDHTAGAGDISLKLGIPALALDSEEGHIQGPVRATFVKNGYSLRTKSFTLRFIHIPGHTPGHGIVFAEGIGVAFTGDALFARSIGYAHEPGEAYTNQLLATREVVLGLPWDTIVCPGHGPLTTIADEKTLNPFFP